MWVVYNGPMLELGRSKWIPVREDGKVLKVNGETQKRLVTETVTRVTRHTYGHNSSKRYNRKLVVSMGAGDVITIRPIGLRDPDTKVSGTVWDIYRMLMNQKAFKAMAVKRAERIAKQKAAKERRAIAAADRRIRLAAKTNRR